MRVTGKLESMKIGGVDCSEAVIPTRDVYDEYIATNYRATFDVKIVGDTATKRTPADQMGEMHRIGREAGAIEIKWIRTPERQICSSCCGYPVSKLSGECVCARCTQPCGEMGLYAFMSEWLKAEFFRRHLLAPGLLRRR